MLYTSVFAWKMCFWYISILWIVDLIWFIRLCNTSTLIETRIKHLSHDSIPLHWYLPLYLTNGSSISMVNPQTHWSSISVVCPLPLLYIGLHPPHLWSVLYHMAYLLYPMVNPQTHWSSISVVCPLPLLYIGLHPPHLTNGSSISMVNPQTHWSSISVVCPLPLLYIGLHSPHLTNESSISMVNPQTHWSSISVVCPLPLLYIGLHPPHLTNGSSIYPWSTHRPIDLLYQWSVLYPFSTLAYILPTWPMNLLYPWSTHRPIDLLYQWSVPLPLLYIGLHPPHLTNGSSISMVNPQTHWSSISVVCLSTPSLHYIILAFILPTIVFWAEYKYCY